jgi:hypothetical protein
MHRLLATALAVLALAATAAYGAPALVPASEVSPQDAPRIEVAASDAGGLSLVFELPLLAAERLSADGREFQSLAIPGGGLSGNVGEPGIPSFTRFLVVPDGAAASVSVTPEDVEEIADVDLLPILDEASQKVSWNAEAYARDDFGVLPAVEVGEPGILRGLRVVPVTFRPIEYNPVQKTLRVAGRLRVDVRFEGESLATARAERSIPATQSFDHIYQALVLNYPSAGKISSQEYGTYLIICPNDAAITSRLQGLIDWRKKKGFPVVLATTALTGTTTTSIKAYIQSAYNTWPAPPEFIVLVGDAAGTYALPTFTDPTYGGEGDFPYAQLDGTDLLPDAHIGRLSISSTNDLDLIVLKMTGYESTPYLTDPGWYTRAALVGDPNSSGFSCVQVMQWIKTRLREMNYTQIDTVFADPFVSQMTTAFNRGDSFVAYRGYYGMSGWSNTNTNGLSNSWKMPFASILTCGTGSFAGSTSISEGFLRAGSGTTASPRAAVGALGVATLNTHTRFNNALQFGVFQAMLYEDTHEMGSALTRAKLELYLNYITREPTFVNAYNYWVNLMGDPAGEIWTGYPAAMAVSHTSSVPVGANSLIVTVTEGGSGSEGARVCVWKGAEAQVVGFTDGAGHCELTLPLLTEGSLFLTVTKHDRYPYLASVPVQKPNTFIGYVASVVDDDTTSTSEGNGDGFASPGESVELQVRVKNFSSSPASSVVATLTSVDPLVTITDATETIGSVPVDSLRWTQDDFDFTVDYAARDAHVLTFGLEVSSGPDQWHSIIEIPVKAPDHVASGYTLYNAGGNGLFDPGETVQVSVRLQNDGSMDGENVVAQLRSLSPFVSVSDTSAIYGTIVQGNFVENTSDRFTISSLSDTYQGHQAVFLLSTLGNGGMRDTTYITVQVGTTTSDDPIGPDQYGYYAFDNTDVGYSEAPVYSWIEIDPTYGGTGTEVVLGDYGEYQDKSLTVTMPFEFQFYGETFNRATICSNGWIAMGSTYLTEYRNWTIPGAGAPSNLIAPFWDNLYRSGTARVCQKYDSVNHIWIVEWSRLLNAANAAQELFQAILFDPSYYPTTSHDGQIVFQYQTVNNGDGTDGYATVGIQNSDHTDGVLYTYANVYPAGAATLATGRAIKFIPIQAAPMGVLSGTVRSSGAGNAPIPGAQVRMLESGRTFMTGVDGTYSGGSQEGTFTVVASHPSFAPDTVQTVVITASQTTPLSFFLTDVAGPSISDVTELFTTTDAVGPYSVDATISDVSGVTSAVVYYRVNGSQWLEAPMTESGGVYTGDIPGWPSGTQIDYYVWADDSNSFESAYPTDAPASFFTLYVTEIGYSHDMEAPGDPNWLLGLPGDTATSGIWVLADPTGTVYNGQAVQPEDDHTPAPGVQCYVTGNGNPGDPVGSNDVDAGCTSLRSPIFDLSAATKAFVHYSRWFGENGNTSDDEFAVDVSNDGGLSWTPLERVQSNANYWSVVSIDVETLLPLSDEVTFRFQACDLGSGGLIEAGIDDFSLEVFSPNSVAAPEGSTVPAPLKLEQSRPNPFATRATIGFSLPKAGAVKLYVYDVQGRTIRRLVDGQRAAGPQVVLWDGRDERGRLSPAGIYFYRLETPNGERMRKILRVD